MNKKNWPNFQELDPSPNIFFTIKSKFICPSDWSLIDTAVDKAEKYFETTLPQHTLVATADDCTSLPFIPFSASLTLLLSADKIKKPLSSPVVPGSQSAFHNNFTGAQYGGC